jgi:hypothetical protein
MRRQLWVNATIVGLALGTVFVVWATRETPTTAELASRKDKLLPVFDSERVTSLRISRQGQVVELERSDDPQAEFRIVRPWQERADIATVKRLLGSLELASALRPADGVDTKAAGLGADALRIQLQMGENRAAVTLGGPAPAPAGARYAEVTSDGNARRFVLSAGMASELDVAIDQLREPSLLEHGKSDLLRIELESPKGKSLLEQRSQVFFTLTDGRAELAERDVVYGIITALSRLTAEQRVEPERARAQLTSAPLRVRLELNDTKLEPITLRFGGPCEQAPTRTLMLREQAGTPGRAGCIPNDIDDALSVTPAELRSSRLFSARVDEVEELRVKQGQHQYVLLRKDSGFRLREGAEREVPLDAGNARLAALLLARGEPSAEPDLAKLGLLPAAGALSIRVAGSVTEETVDVGRTLGDGKVCAKRNLDQVVLCFPAEAARAFDADTTLLRGPNVLSFSPSELRRLTVIAGGQRETIVRHPDGSYELTEPAGFSHDGSLVADAVQTLSTLVATRWVSLTDDASFGLARPRAELEITLGSDTAPRRLVIGAPVSGGYFARLSPDPAVFVLPAAAFDDLVAPHIDRALCPCAEQELASVELTTPRGTGVIRGATVSLPHHRPELGETLKALRAERALHFGPARPDEGFAGATSKLKYTTRDGRVVEVVFGSCETKNDGKICYARRSDVDATFAVAARVVKDLTSPPSQ